MPTDIKSLTRDELEARFKAWKQPAYRVTQLLEWLYVHRVATWDAMTNLPGTLREKLGRDFSLQTLELVRKQGARDSSSVAAYDLPNRTLASAARYRKEQAAKSELRRVDTTQKFLWRLHDHLLIESVLIPANPALYGEASDRHTLCVSTQVGCAYGCKFCASGLDGLKRNLTPDEIVEQVLAVERWNALSSSSSSSKPTEEPITRTRTTTRTNERLIDNLVIMGMGEPLANYDNLLKALRILNAPWGGGIGARKITISSSGLAPQIRRLADEPLQFRLAISLHGATDEVRNKIMPVNRKYPLKELVAACEHYQGQKGRMLTFEYILIAGVNDSVEQAKPLAALARRLFAKVNLIPYNTLPGMGEEEDLQDLFENAPCGYLSAQPDGRITKVNTTFLSWLGFSRQEVIGRRFQDLLNIAGKIYFETHFAPLLRMQGFFNEVALDLVGADDRRLPVLVNAVERRAEGGDVRFIRITVFNASDRRRYEQELLESRRLAEAATAELQSLNHSLEDRVTEAVNLRLQAEDALRQAQKMEAIGQLTGGVAHDFNNLLTVILGGLETISKLLPNFTPGPASERMQRSVTMAVHGAERAAALTARLLAFSRRQALDPKPIDAAGLVTGIADLLQRTLGETIALITVSGAGLWRTIADPNELENALVNLAVNARDAMPKGGRLTIETSNAYLDEAYVAAIPEPVDVGQYVLLAVTDTGVGMSPETLVQVFEPFFTTKEVGKGTGLGLSQVYGFVRQSGGHVRIYSEVGEGTTVKIYLPRLLDELSPAAVPTGAVALPAHGGRETILLVEDHDDLRLHGAELLSEFGYRVLTASDAGAALEILAKDIEVDLLFTDVVLPHGMDGRRLAGVARERRPGLKVLFTTGYSRNAIVHNGRLDPGVELITKPFTSNELGLKVRKLLDD